MCTAAIRLLHERPPRVSTGTAHLGTTRLRHHRDVVGRRSRAAGSMWWTEGAEFHRLLVEDDAVDATTETGSVDHRQPPTAASTMPVTISVWNAHCPGVTL